MLSTARIKSDLSRKRRQCSTSNVHRAPRSKRKRAHPVKGREGDESYFEVVLSSRRSQDGGFPLPSRTHAQPPAQWSSVQGLTHTHTRLSGAEPAPGLLPGTGPPVGWPGARAHVSVITVPVDGSTARMSPTSWPAQVLLLLPQLCLSRRTQSDSHRLCGLFTPVSVFCFVLVSQCWGRNPGPRPGQTSAPQPEERHPGPQTGSFTEPLGFPVFPQLESSFPLSPGWCPRPDRRRVCSLVLPPKGAWTATEHGPPRAGLLASSVCGLSCERAFNSSGQSPRSAAAGSEGKHVCGFG